MNLRNTNTLLLYKHKLMSHMKLPTCIYTYRHYIYIYIYIF